MERPAVSPPKHSLHRRANTYRLLTGLILLSLLWSAPPRAAAQADRDEALSQKEVDTLRDTADEPVDRIAAFEQFLNDRQKRIAELVTKRRGHTDYGGDMHDALDQFGQIVDELNDNLDDYVKQHRDIRKALPKLQELTDKWLATLRTPSDNEAYNIVRRIAVDNVNDTRTLLETTRTELDAYFKAHPEAALAEKRRAADPHRVRPE